METILKMDTELRLQNEKASSTPNEHPECIFILSTFSESADVKEEIIEETRIVPGSRDGSLESFVEESLQIKIEATELKTETSDSHLPADDTTENFFEGAEIEYESLEQLMNLGAECEEGRTFGEAETEHTTQDRECATENSKLIEYACRNFPKLAGHNITPDKFDCFIELERSACFNLPADDVSSPETQVPRFVKRKKKNVKCTCCMLNGAKKNIPQRCFMHPRKNDKCSNRKSFLRARRSGKKTIVHKCDICSKHFITENHLRAHEETHTSDCNNQLSIMTVPEDVFEKTVQSMLSKVTVPLSKRKSAKCTRRKGKLKLKDRNGKLKYKPKRAYKRDRISPFCIELVDGKFKYLSLKHEKRRPSRRVSELPSVISEEGIFLSKLDEIRKVNASMLEDKSALLRKSTLNIITPGGAQGTPNDKESAAHKHFGICVEPSFPTLAEIADDQRSLSHIPEKMPTTITSDYFSSLLNNPALNTPKQLSNDVSSLVSFKYPRTNCLNETGVPQDKKSGNTEQMFDEDVYSSDTDTENVVDDVIALLDNSDETCEVEEGACGVENRALSRNNKKRSLKTKHFNKSSMRTGSAIIADEHNYSILSKHSCFQCQYCGCVFSNSQLFTFHLDNYHSECYFSNSGVVKADDYSTIPRPVNKTTHSSNGDIQQASTITSASMEDVDDENEDINTPEVSNGDILPPVTDFQALLNEATQKLMPNPSNVIELYAIITHGEEEQPVNEDDPFEDCEEGTQPIFLQSELCDENNIQGIDTETYIVIASENGEMALLPYENGDEIQPVANSGQGSELNKSSREVPNEQLSDKNDIHVPGNKGMTENNLTSEILAPPEVLRISEEIMSNSSDSKEEARVNPICETPQLSGPGCSTAEPLDNGNLSNNSVSAEPLAIEILPECQHKAQHHPTPEIRGLTPTLFDHDVYRATPSSSVQCNNDKHLHSISGTIHFNNVTNVQSAGKSVINNLTSNRTVDEVAPALDLSGKIQCSSASNKSDTTPDNCTNISSEILQDVLSSCPDSSDDKMPSPLPDNGKCGDPRLTSDDESPTNDEQISILPSSFQDRNDENIASAIPDDDNRSDSAESVNFRLALSDDDPTTNDEQISVKPKRKRGRPRKSIQRKARNENLQVVDSSDVCISLDEPAKRKPGRPKKRRFFHFEVARKPVGEVLNKCEQCHLLFEIEYLKNVHVHICCKTFMSKDVFSLGDKCEKKCNCAEQKLHQSMAKYNCPVFTSKSSARKSSKINKVLPDADIDIREKQPCSTSRTLDKFSPASKRSNQTKELLTDGAHKEIVLKDCYVRVTKLQLVDPFKPTNEKLEETRVENGEHEDVSVTERSNANKQTEEALKENVRDYICDDSSSPLPSRETVINDLRNRIDDVTKKINALKTCQCERCDIAFVSKAQLKMHCVFKHGSTKC